MSLCERGQARLKDLETRELLTRSEIREWAGLKLQTLDRPTVRLLLMLGDDL